MDANIISYEQLIASLPKKTIVTPPEVSHSKSLTSTNDTITIDTTTVPPPPPPPPPATSTILSTSISEVIVHDDDDDEDDVMVGFAALEFNPEEDDVPDNDIMSGKQFKIPNFKLISILLFVNDSIRKSSVSGVETDIPNKRTYVLGYGHLKTFLDAYFTHLALIDINLSTHLKRTSKVPKALLKGKMSKKDYEDGEIVHDPLGVVFIGKSKKDNMKKFLLRIDDVERYSN
ncbi:unnamed protein product [Lactuca virosa]|uniref:Uncharacterized protein n=1 Tax=Lactuca virosa TaxID=75947 RepID=A0AAU9MGB7_9ASTR|nr:unnamed protein product [Lactuca virosa]